jgi:hypothetical protein
MHQCSSVMQLQATPRTEIRCPDVRASPAGCRHGALPMGTGGLASLGFMGPRHVPMGLIIH